MINLKCNIFCLVVSFLFTWVTTLCHHIDFGPANSSFSKSIEPKVLIVGAGDVRSSLLEARTDVLIHGCAHIRITSRKVSLHISIQTSRCDCLISRGKLDAIVSWSKVDLLVQARHLRVLTRILNFGGKLILCEGAGKEVLIDGMNISFDLLLNGS